MVTAQELAGEPITAKLTRAPGNNAEIGGLKVITQNGWFAARPSGTEDIYKIYAESFLGEETSAEDTGRGCYDSQRSVCCSRSLRKLLVKSFSRHCSDDKHIRIFARET